MKNNDDNNIKIFNMHCGAHYHAVKFEIKIQLVCGEAKKDKLYYGAK